MPIEKVPNAEPIRGYHLIEPLGSGGFGEVWKCEAPGGICKAIKFVQGSSDEVDDRCKKADEELRAVQHIKSIRHPFLLSIDRVEVVNGELLIVTELADQNLHELLQKYRALGKIGVPRDEIIAYLREAAEVLDLMNLKFDLQHLDIKPRNLFLVSNHVKVADFGLVNSLAGSGGKIHLGAITPLYAAPELFQGKLSRHCDQYSLAIVYQELLTGTLPFVGRNSRQLLMQHMQAEPNLDALSATDRPIIARALAKNPDHRYPSCEALVRALAGETMPPPSSDPDLGPLLRTAETQVAADTERIRPVKAPPLPPNVLPDYRFIESQGSSPVMDLWKVQSPNGRNKLVKFVYGFNSDPKRFPEAVARLKELHHPGLVPNEVVHVDKGRIVLLSDAVKETVRDRFQQCVIRKSPGIPRNELIDHLRAAAEVLDYLYQQYGLQHLALNPRSFVLDHGWLQINDFGLAHLLWHPAGQDVAQRNARYSAPELFAKSVNRTCDQFSLALIYAEMLTGQHPFRNQGNLAWSGKRDRPALDHLSPKEQDVIRRALDPDPGKRWSHCTDLIMALEETPATLSASANNFESMIKSNRAVVPTPAMMETVPHPIPDIEDIIRNIVGDNPDSADCEVAEISPETDSISHRFQVGMPLGSARLKLESFCKQSYGQLTRDDENGVVMQLAMPSNFWQQWLGKQPGLEIRIHLARANAAAPTPIEIYVNVSAHRCSRKRGYELLEEMGPVIIDNLRKHLLVNSDKRTQDRVMFPCPLRIIPVGADGLKEEPIECRGKDISQSGIGFYLPHELATSEVLIELPSMSRPPKVQIPAMLVRAKPSTDGWYEVGALFRVASRRSSVEFHLPAAREKRDPRIESPRAEVHLNSTINR
jgi:serine/threonine protein kinase